MGTARASLFTPRFFVMCGFSFTVFVSAFMLLPTAPFRILDLGGAGWVAGLFLGLLTYASAFSAPVTGALADRLGTRRVLVSCSLVIAAFSLAYAVAPPWPLLLALVPFHGVFWSALLSASAAYMTDLLPETRRAEGIGYWGLSTMFAVAFAPALGFSLYRHGWAAVCLAAAVLNLIMAAIAWRLEETEVRAHPGGRLTEGGLVEWRVLLLSLTLFLYSFGYGGITSFSALGAEARGIQPRSLYFTVLALVIIATRPFSGPLADRIGHRRVFLPCLVLIVAGLALLGAGDSRLSFVASAMIFGAGFGTAYPVFAAYVMRHVEPRRRGAAFGGILAAFDTGIGTGSIATGWLVHAFGFGRAFGFAALLASLALPYFLFAEKRFLGASRG